MRFFLFVKKGSWTLEKILLESSVFAFYGNWTSLHHISHSEAANTGLAPFNSIMTIFGGFRRVLIKLKKVG